MDGHLTNCLTSCMHGEELCFYQLRFALMRELESDVRMASVDLTNCFRELLRFDQLRQE